MAFFGYCFQYMLKINLGIGIVCMINNTALQEEIYHQKIISNHQDINTSKLIFFDTKQIKMNNTANDNICLFELKHLKSMVIFVY